MLESEKISKKSWKKPEIVPLKETLFGPMTLFDLMTLSDPSTPTVLAPEPATVNVPKNW